MGSGRPGHASLCDDHWDSGPRIDVDDAEMAGGRNLSFQGIHRFVASALGGSCCTEGTTRDAKWSTLAYRESGSEDTWSPGKPREILPRKRGSGERTSEK